jgi:hypothetical protein
VAKLIVFSLILVSCTVPVWMSTRSAPKRALRTTQWIILGFIVVWAYLCVAWYPALVPND